MENDKELKQENNDIQVVSNYNVYGFEVGSMIIEESGQTEKKALINLVNNYWDLIDKNDSIELMGKRRSINTIFSNVKVG